jgi:hypothetical protein
MATIIDLGKIRFDFKGVYAGGITYEVNDVVKYGGNLYVYTYGIATSGNVPTNTTYWDLMMEGFNFEGIFDTGTTYNIGDAFSHGGIVYIVTANTVVGQTPPNASYYSTFVDGLQFEGTWDVGTAYQKADLVTYGGKSYIALQDTTGDIPSSSGAQWDIFADGIGILGTWQAATAYIKNDVVTYGGSTYRALQDVAQNVKPSAGSPNWGTFVTGFDLKDSFDSATAYVKDDIVLFGANLFRAKGDVTGVHPMNTVSWAPFLSGFSYVGAYDAARKYFIGEIVLHGGNLYQAKLPSTGSEPSGTAAAWEIIATGFTAKGDWATGTVYAPGDIVKHGGSAYVVETYHTAAAAFATDLAANRVAEFVSGVKNRGTWSAGADYIVNDMVISGNSSYIALTTHTSTANFSTDLGNGNWQVFAAGGGGVLPTVGSSDVGKSLVVKGDGTGYELDYVDNSPNTYYVAHGGVDATDAGKSAQRPFATVQYCMTRIAAEKTADSSAQVFIKDGVYRESLPITVPSDTTVFGDGQRNTTIEPAAGDSNKTMFFVNDGVLMKELKLQGLTGFALDSANGEPDNIEKATIGGVFLRLDPTAVINKSPYIKECSAFSTGGVGVLIDGGLNSNPANNGSMVFHTFTQIHSGGVGFWVRRNGKAEIVSCFTYYCDFGYATSGGGQIRALNGNNSYGTYGTVSSGNDSSEVTLNGSVRGYNLDYQDGSLKNGEFTKGGIVAAVDRTFALNTIAKTSPARATTVAPHGMTDGALVSFNTLLPASWSSSANATSYYADVQDSYSFDLYTNTALSNPASGEAWGGRHVTNTSITDITRSNPMTTTVASHTLDSYDLIRIQGVGGMTQVNDQYFLVMDHSSSIIKFKEAENNYIAVATNGSNAAVITGVAGGVTHSAAVEPTLSLYKGSRYYFDIDSSNGNGFYLTTSDPASVTPSLSYTGEYTTGVTGSRAVKGGRLAITIDSSAPATLYYANSGNVLAAGTINIAAPGDVDATSYSVYTSGGQLRKTDSGDALISGNMSRIGSKALIVDHQPGANKLIIDNIIGTGFQDGDSISDSGNASNVYAKLTVSDAAHDQFGYTMAFTGLTGARPKTGGSVQFIANLGDSGYDSVGSYVIQTVGDYDSSTGNALLVFAQQKADTRKAPKGQQVKIRYKYSQARLTGHDFLNIGFGNKTQTNYPGTPSLAAAQGNEVVERDTGRVYFVSTDQSGNFRVGNYFRIDQATGRATLDASAFDLSGLTSLRLGSIGAQLGEAINEFSADGSLAGNSNLAVPTEQAVKTYVDAQLEIASTKSLPKTAKGGDLATEQYIGFNIHDLTKLTAKGVDKA